MTLKMIRPGLLFAGAALLATAPAVATAQQTQPEGKRWNYGFQLGGRLFLKGVDDSLRGKFELYRHTPEAPFGGLRVQGTSADGLTRFTLGASQIGERDQSAWLRVNQLRKYDLSIQWDRIQHTYSTTARFPGYTLATPRPTATQWNAFALSDPVRVRWDPVKVKFGFSPADRWDFKAEYTWLDKAGNRQMGMGFGSPGGNLREILEPVDQTIHDVRLTQSFEGERVHASVSYNFSLFQQSVTSVTADNPSVATETATAAARGRSALPPGNQAHTFAFSGSARLPYKTRLNGTVSYSLRRQHEEFLPHTINAAISNAALALPREDLEGDGRTFLVNLAATNRLDKNLTLSARFRHFKYDDKTEELIFPAHVVNDAPITIGDLEREHFPWSKTNGSAAATWRFGKPAKLTGSWGWENWKRAIHRNVRNTDEHTGRLALDLVPNEWLTLRGSGSFGWRRARGQYRQINTTQLPELRRYDQADRNRTRFDILADVGVTDQVSITGTWTFVNDTFPDQDLFDANQTPYGTQRNRSSILGGDLNWTPSPRFSGGLIFTYESYKSRLRSRNRLPTPPALLSNLTWDWVSNSDDKITTFGINFQAVVVPNQFEVGGSLQVADATLETRSFNPNGTPTGGTASQNAQAVASDFPDIKDKWTPANGWVRYRFNSDWAATLRYVYDKWTNVDWRSDDLVPAPTLPISGTVSADRFLGPDYRDYTAGFVTLSITYRPRLFRAGRSAL